MLVRGWGVAGTRVVRVRDKAKPKEGPGESVTDAVEDSPFRNFPFLCASLRGSYRILQDLTGSYRILQVLTGSYRILQDLTGSYRFLQVLTGSYRSSSGY